MTPIDLLHIYNSLNETPHLYVPTSIKSGHPFFLIDKGTKQQVIKGFLTRDEADLYASELIEQDFVPPSNIRTGVFSVAELIKYLKRFNEDVQLLVVKYKDGVEQATEVLYDSTALMN